MGTRHRDGDVGPGRGCGTAMLPASRGARLPLARVRGVLGTAGRVAQRSKTDPGRGLRRPPTGVILSPRGERLKFCPPGTNQPSLGSSSVSVHGTPVSASRSRTRGAPGAVPVPRERCRCPGKRSRPKVWQDPGALGQRSPKPRCAPRCPCCPPSPSTAAGAGVGMKSLRSRCFPAELAPPTKGCA